MDRRRAAKGLLAGTLALAALITTGASGATDPISTIAGSGEAGAGGDGAQATVAQLYKPSDVAPLPGGGYLIADSLNHLVRKVDANGTISTVAGGGDDGEEEHYGGDGGPATSATLEEPASVAPTADGGFLIADTKNNRIREVSPAGTIETVAGTGSSGFLGDGGSATEADLNEPDGVAATADGGFLIADTKNNRIREVSSAGTIDTVAGTGLTSGDLADVPAIAATLEEPRDVAPTADGGFLIADTRHHRIAKVDEAGDITTVAGSGPPGSTGDDAPATSAQLDEPAGVAPTPDGGFLIADTNNHRVRQVSASGEMKKVAGTTQGYGGDGQPATSARLDTPLDVAAAASGYLIADSGNHRIRLVGANDQPPAAVDDAAPNAAVAPLAPAPAPAPPVLGKRFIARPGSGIVLVKLPGHSRYARLGAAASIPVGSVVDATRGAVWLRVAKDRRGGTQTGRFSAGAFEVRQPPAPRPVTDLLLRGRRPQACPPFTGGARPSAARRRPASVRKLWARVKGRFRTRGRHGAATVRGTIWLTEDRCEGTLVYVKDGVVDVRDFTRHQTVVVRAGERHLSLAHLPPKLPGTP